ncbi:MAG: hypothetical protein RL685_6906, partial [Pseudomonadota bacterium]
MGVRLFRGDQQRPTSPPFRHTGTRGCDGAIRYTRADCILSSTGPMQSLMTSTTRPSIQPSARARRTYTWLLALAVGPGLVAVSCSDDAEPDTLGTGGTAGSSSTATAGSGGSSSGGSAGAAAGSGGAGTNSAAGSGGTAGNTGEAGTVGLPEDGPDASTAATFTLTSPAFNGEAGCGPDGDAPDLCDLFPEENTGLNGAANVSPQL